MSYKTIITWIVVLLISFLFAQCTSKGQQNNSEDENEKNSSEFKADIVLKLTATSKEVQLLPGPKSNVYTYEPELLKGDKNVLKRMNGTYLGPIIRVKPGQNIRVRFKNELPRESVIHWHGLHIPPEMDGHPMYAVGNNDVYIYEFTVNNRPGTYWFHPHPDKITGYQVYHGLAGLFIVEGKNKELPSGSYDIPIIIQDRTFDSNNQLVYLGGSRMARMRGFLGENIFINGSRNHQMQVKQGAYRFRVLNGSNSRIYKLAWSDGSDITAIATGGGLLEQPVNKPYIMLAPGERIEIWKDFSNHSGNENVMLKSLPFESGTRMGMGGMMGNRMSTTQNLENGAEMNLVEFSISEEQGSQKQLPADLSELENISTREAINRSQPRKFHFSFEHMQWVINGETFEMDEVAEWEKVKLNTTEIWEFINGGERGGMGMMGNMMQMPHPVHIHGLQFQIVERDISGVDASVWQSVKDGFVDKGWQDTFLLMSGMNVRVIMRFEDFTGKYIYHCHNLEHEDMGMMRNYEVIDN